jgi:apolipoprotein N-acyltransferase
MDLRGRRFADRTRRKAALVANETLEKTAQSTPREPVAAPTRPLARLAGSVAGGVLLYLAFPPLGLWFLAPVGVALLTLAVYGVRARRAAWLGYVGAVAFLLPTLAWVRPIGDDAWVALVAIESLYWAALAVAASVVTRLRWWPLWVGCLWVLQEWARGVFPIGGFPWARLAFSQGESPFTPFAALGGAPLVSFAVVLCGALAALAALRLRTPGGHGPPGPQGPWRPRWDRAVAWPLAGVLAVPLAAYAVPRPGAAAGDRSVRIGIVQGNVPGRGMNFLGDQPAVVLNNHAGETHAMAAAVRAGTMPRPDLVIWPENSTDIDPYRSDYAYQTIDAAVRDIGVPVLVGAVVRTADGQHRYTRSLVWNPATGPGASYDKQKLVPFGEYTPFKDLLERFIKRLSLVGLQSLPGDRPGDLKMGQVTVGAINCYEVAYDGVVEGTTRAGGSPLVVQTNNATYALTNLPAQQLAMSQLRAVEHNRAVVTAATTGISAYVNPDGRVGWHTGELVAGMNVVTVPLRSRDTVATRVGAIPEWMLILVGTGALAVALVRGRRSGASRVTEGGATPDREHDEEG